jgi:hypothetical protein
MMAAALSSGCYELTVRNGLPAEPKPTIRDRFTGGFANGLVDEESLLRLDAVCPNGWAEIHYETSFINGLLSSIRGLIYNSTSVSIYCAVNAPGPPPGALVVVTAPPGSAPRGMIEVIPTPSPGSTVIVPAPPAR